MLSNRKVAGSGPVLIDPFTQYSSWLFRGFVRYLHRYVRHHFHSVLISLQGLPRAPMDRPLIIYGNHPSWWDPILFVLISEASFPGRRGYGPMEAKSLTRYSILKRLGAFGIDLESSRGAVEFMIQAKRILAHRSSILWLTVEGAFTDVRQRPPKMRQGLGYLARMSPGIVVLPLALEYPFWNESHPEALCRFGEPIEVNADTALRSAADWNEIFKRALTKTMDSLACESMQRDPTLFHPLLTGRSGVGGIYDGWRRMRAWSRGARFDASHGKRR